MPRLLTIALLLVLAQQSLPVFAQDDTATEEGQSSEPATGSDEADADAAADEEDIEDADLDEQTYEEDEEDFVPTEEIPVDEPIPFPTNI